MLELIRCGRDFGKWVNDFTNTLDNEINSLSQDVSQTGNALNERIAFFTNQSGYHNDWKGIYQLHPYLDYHWLSHLQAALLWNKR